MSKVLFIGPQFMGIYKDIISEFVRRGDEVDFIAERSLDEDPYNVRGAINRGGAVNAERFFLKNENYWKHELCDKSEFNKKYDVLFVLDGQGLHPILFDILKERNPNLYSINYLFDTTKGVYRFNEHFPLFDKVVTFDLTESKKYGICFLPIFWIPVPSSPIKYKFFGLGRYNQDRAKLFKELQDISDINHFDSYLKLQGEHIKLFDIKYFIRLILGNIGNRVTWRDYHSDMYIIDPLSVDDFRHKISESELIVDTCAPHQDGLTARFMWALGLGKKIITTNKSAKQYPFYSPDQIFVVQDIEKIKTDKSFISFIDSKFIHGHELYSNIDAYRIDKWLDTLLNK